MQISVLIILIFSACILYGVKTLNESYYNGTLEERLEKAAKKALRVTLKGSAVIGFIALALLCFPVVRYIGFNLFSASMIDVARLMMELLFDTRSVYASLQAFAGVTIILMEFTFVFSFIGFLFIKAKTYCFSVQEEKKNEKPIQFYAEEVYTPFAPKKLFLNFANLRI